MIDDRMVSVITSTPMDMMFTIHAAHVGRELAQGDRRLHRRRRGRHARPCQEARRENMPAGST
ncbi:MAG: hypothetical protein ACLSVD_01030 [Eggerthellaceae bacterium]